MNLSSLSADLYHCDALAGGEAADTPETIYARHTSPVHRKRFGQFFTPPKVASLMADWLAQASPRSVLDPAVGTGALLRAMAARLPTANLVGHEIDRTVLEYARLPRSAEVSLTDFLTAEFEESYDGVIMNPPYIRHREIEGYDHERAKISVRAGFVIPRSANLYIYFCAKTLVQLNPGGRAAFLIPSEWLNANFSATFKSFLLDGEFLREVVCFSSCSNVFDDALTTASVLLLEKPQC